MNMNIVHQISMTKTAYYAFLYSDRQLNDIEKFCCCDGISDPLATDITFNLCDLWLIDTSYRNRRLVVEVTGKSPVFFGSCMFHFKKDEEAFRKFALEMCGENLKSIELRAVGIDMASAIYLVFKNNFKDLSRIYDMNICVRHLQQRDEKKLKSFWREQTRHQRKRRNQRTKF